MIRKDDFESMSDKVQKARVAQKAWWQAGVAHRKECVRVFMHMLLERVDVLARELTQETHKPLTQAKNEIKGTAGRIAFFLEHIDAVLQPESVYEDKGVIEKIAYEPLGVVANISAWNYPYFVGTNVIIPALLAGNAVLYKPSEYATHTGFLMLDALHASGVPKDVCALVVGDGAQGAQLCQQKIDGLFFTGSYGTGVKIAQAAAGSLMKVQLELGGKDAVYVCDDVDVKNVADAVADGAFYNTGQSCCAVERVYVHASVYDVFMGHFVDTVKRFVVGDPMDENTYIAPLTRASQVSVLTHQIDDAVQKGARVVCGGRVLAEGLLEPTVLVDVNHGMALMQEESFGPVIGVMKVSGDAEAVSAMNDSAYGLTASVYTQDPSRAEKILKEMHTGTVYVNACDRVSPRLPWTGRGHSGVGSTLGVLGMRAMLQPKAWHIKHS